MHYLAEMHISNPVQQIEARAQQAGLSVTELCHKAGVARSTFTRWKAGTTSPTQRILKRLARELPDEAPKIRHKLEV